MEQKTKKTAAILYAVLAAVFYAINMPMSKLLLQKIEPTFMASFLYLGAGIGIGLIWLLGKKRRKQEQKLSKQDLPYTVGMIVLDIAAPILLMIGLTSATSANASLLNNFEIAATSLIALFVFKEVISPRLWAAIVLITVASMLLSFEDLSGFRFSLGSLFILAAAVCWGFENNFTRKISSKSTYQIVLLKGIFSGLGSFSIALILKENFPQIQYVLYALALGFVAYGLSIFLYVRAQKELGAAQTSAYYAVAPFIGALLSFVILKEAITENYVAALLIMIAGSVLAVYDTLLMRHTHPHLHTAAYGGSTPTQTLEHTHEHRHLISQENHTHRHIDMKDGKWFKRKK